MAKATTHLTTGQRAEDLACRHLQQHGLLLLARNYRCRVGELDLVMRDGDCLVFVEVRSRRSNAYGSAAESVTWRKQQRLQRAALHYLQRQRSDVPCRFDIVAISQQHRDVTLEWIKDAFQA